MRFTLPTLYNTLIHQKPLSPHTVWDGDCIVTQRHRVREAESEMDEEVAGGCWGFILVGHEGKASPVTVGDAHAAVDLRSSHLHFGKHIYMWTTLLTKLVLCNSTWSLHMAKGILALCLLGCLSWFNLGPSFPKQWNPKPLFSVRFAYPSQIHQTILTAQTCPLFISTWCMPPVHDLMHVCDIWSLA